MRATAYARVLSPTCTAPSSRRLGTICRDFHSLFSCRENIASAFLAQRIHFYARITTALLHFYPSRERTQFRPVCSVHCFVGL